MVDIVEALSGTWEDGTRPADLYAAHVCRDPESYVPVILDCLRTCAGKPRSGCAELASRVSADRPDILWPERALFVTNLDSDAPVVRWEAACVLGNLASVDRDGELRATIPALERLLDETSIVLQGHAARALAKMASAYPKEARGILEALTGAERNFPGSRVGILVETMPAFGADPDLRAQARRFAERFLDHDVKAVQSKARRAVKQLAPEEEDGG